MFIVLFRFQTGFDVLIPLERLGMSVSARLKASKANTGQDRYGYLRIGDKIHVVEEEADWVRRIFERYNQGVPLSQIRERLIVGNAPQKGNSTPRHIHWARSSIQGILESAKEYAYGYKEQSRDGETFQTPVEPIIDIPTYELFKTQRERNKTNSPCFLQVNSTTRFRLTTRL